MEGKKHSGLLINAVLSLKVNSAISPAQNGASDWHCLAPHRHTGTHTHSRFLPHTHTLKVIAAVFLSAKANGKHLRVDTEHNNVLPQVSRPDHFHNARLLVFILKSSLQFCKKANMLILAPYIGGSYQYLSITLTAAKGGRS